MLLAGIHERVCTSGDARLQGAGVTWSGRMVRRRQRHHSGLWCDVFTTELNVEGGMDSRSLTARKHTVRVQREGKTNVTITSFAPAHSVPSRKPFLMTTKALADLSHLPTAPSRARQRVRSQ